MHSSQIEQRTIEQQSSASCSHASRTCIVWCPRKGLRDEVSLLAATNGLDAHANRTSMAAGCWHACSVGLRTPPRPLTDVSTATVSPIATGPRSTIGKSRCSGAKGLRVGQCSNPHHPGLSKRWVQGGQAKFLAGSIDDLKHPLTERGIMDGEL